MAAPMSPKPETSPTTARHTQHQSLILRPDKQPPADAELQEHVCWWASAGMRGKASTLETTHLQGESRWMDDANGVIWPAPK